MTPEIEQLVKLQGLDVEATRLKAELAKLPAEGKRALAELDSARKTEAAATVALAAEEALRAKHDVQIDQHRKKAARLRGQLDTVTTQAQAQAFEHEIGFNESEAVRLEAEAFASLERTEAQESALAAAKALGAELDQALGKIRARAQSRETEYKAELDRIAADRDALRPAIPADLLARFDRIAATRGTGLARAENQLCTGCRMGVRPMVWNQLREGQLLTCDSCGRMLYWDPAVFAGLNEKGK